MWPRAFTSLQPGSVGAAPLGLPSAPLSQQKAHLQARPGLACTLPAPCLGHAPGGLGLFLPALEVPHARRWAKDRHTVGRARGPCSGCSGPRGGVGRGDRAPGWSRTQGAAFQGDLAAGPKRHCRLVRGRCVAGGRLWGLPAGSAGTEGGRPHVLSPAGLGQMALICRWFWLPSPNSHPHGVREGSASPGPRMGQPQGKQAITRPVDFCHHCAIAASRSPTCREGSQAVPGGRSPRAALGSITKFVLFGCKRL